MVSTQNISSPMVAKVMNNFVRIRNFELPRQVPLVTYTTRGFEPYRGWEQVAKGISLLMQRNAQVHVLLVGSDEVAYGSKRSDGISWREWAFKKYNYDESRIHFLPPLQYDEYLKFYKIVGFIFIGQSHLF